MRTDGHMRRVKIAFLSFANAKHTVQEPGCDDGKRCISVTFMYAGFYFVVLERHMPKRWGSWECKSVYHLSESSTYGVPPSPCSFFVTVRERAALI